MKLFFKQIETKSTLNWIVAILLALCPILQHYDGLIADARATAMALCIPFFLYWFWKKNEVRWFLVAPVLIYSIYRVIHEGFSFGIVCREGLFCFFILAVSSGLLDFEKFKKVVIGISCVATVVIIIQYFCYYVLGFHLQVVPTGCLRDNAAQWIGMAETGRISIKGNWMSMYRPSAFFLEPSHMALFGVPSVLMLLLSPKINKWRVAIAALLSIGIIASTSGLGIALTLGIWMLYFVFYCGEESGCKEIKIGKFKIKELRVKDIHIKGFSIGKFEIKPFTIRGFVIRPIAILLGVGMILAVLAMYCFVGPFRSSINRILFTEDGYNAISGRTRSGIAALSRMNFKEFIFGVTEVRSEASWYMSAFYETIYDYGVIGFVSSYFLYVLSLFKLKRQYFWMTLMILGLSFFTVHTHNGAYMLFFCTFLLAGFYDECKNDLSQWALKIHPLRFLKK